MCEFCDDPNCTLTKEQVLKRGAILENNACQIMRDKTDEYSYYTYAFRGIPAYNSYGALVPDEDDENPHIYFRIVYDEDEDCYEDYEYYEVTHPLSYQTEHEFLDKYSKEHNCEV